MTELAEGDASPDFSLPGRGGKTVRLSDLRGRKVIKFLGIERSTFLIDEGGRIAKIWRRVKAAGHAAAVLGALNG